jgi:peptidoglycan pentaglycine glycine transferase (the first glycine)
MDAQPWNSLISNFPDSHILQTWEWGNVKSKYGWLPLQAIWYEKPDGSYFYTLDQQHEGLSPCAAALIMQRDIQIRGFPTGLKLLYVPKGPLLQDWGNAALRMRVLDDLKIIAKRQSATFIKIDPDVRIGTGIPGQNNAQQDELGESILKDLEALGWRYSNEQIQFANTVVLDLSASEDEILARMKPKTRYNIRLAERKGVIVRQGSANDLELLYHLYAETAVRDGFVIRTMDYYHTLWNTFLNAGKAYILIAEADEQPIAALILFKFQRRAWFLYGMSREIHREKMPNYLLQWEAIHRSKQAGCQIYDLWGAPYQFDENDPLWGVYRFKEGLGGQVVRHIGAWDLPVRRTGYRLFSQLLPRVLAVMRSQGMAKTKQNLSEST